MKYEYIESDPESWQPFIEPPFDRAFQRELELIAGKTGNKPNLRLVWAGTLKDDRTESKVFLKYHAGYTVPKTVGFRYLKDGEEFFTDNIETIPPEILGVVPVVKSQPLGWPRWVIERYTSPQVLEQMKRFRQRRGENDYTVLREFPREGIYEYWQVIEDRDGFYREPGSDILPYLRAKWRIEQTPAEVQGTQFREWLDRQSAKKATVRHQRFRAAAEGDIILPHEERARREWMENKIKEDLERERHNNQSVSVYQN